ncbi:MAG: hypothetical protein J6M60_00690 [Clostridia bacterium]|nr:hypothetical protein [Clostridia bacterium]
MKKNIEITVKGTDGKQFEMQFNPEYLGEIAKNVKFANEDEIDFPFKDSSGKERYVHFPVAFIRMIVKSLELSNPVIPRVLTPYLCDMTYYFSMKAKIKLVGRDHEIEKIWFYLSQKKRNNVFLVGAADVGKTAICREIIRQISVNECPKEFFDTRVFMLDADALFKIIGKKQFKIIYKMLTNFIIKNKDKCILYIEDSVEMLMHDNLWDMLEMLVTKHNVPILTASSPENMQEYFLEIDSISKYINIVYIREPELDEIYPMIKMFIKKKEKEYQIKAPKEIVEFGIFSSPLSDSISANPGNVVSIFEKAFLEAKRKGKKVLDKKSILSSYDTDLKHYYEMPESEKIATAYHETGHFIATVMSDRLKDQKIAYVTILPMSWFLGLTQTYNKDNEDVVLSRDYYLDHIAMLMAGRVAEQKIKEANSGASSDLETATRIAKAMVMNFGLSSKNSNRCYEQSDYFFLPEEKKKEIDQEVQSILDEGYKRAEMIISEHEPLLKDVAEQLVKGEILTGEYLNVIVKKYKKTQSKMCEKKG